MSKTLLQFRMMLTLAATAIMATRQRILSQTEGAALADEIATADPLPPPDEQEILKPTEDETAPKDMHGEDDDAEIEKADPPPPPDEQEIQKPIDDDEDEYTLEED